MRAHLYEHIKWWTGGDLPELWGEYVLSGDSLLRAQTVYFPARGRFTLATELARALRGDKTVIT